MTTLQDALQEHDDNVNETRRAESIAKLAELHKIVLEKQSDLANAVSAVMLHVRIFKLDISQESVIELYQDRGLMTSADAQRYR